MNKPPLYTARIAAAEIDDGSWGGRGKMTQHARPDRFGAAEIDDGSWRGRGRDRALVQLARFWRVRPPRRESMVAESPAPATAPATVAKVAAVVHFLCLHDDIAVPAWTQGHRADPEVMLFDIPLDSRYGQMMQQTAPAVCAAYGVYFTWNPARLVARPADLGCRTR